MSDDRKWDDPPQWDGQDARAARWPTEDPGVRREIVGTMSNVDPDNRPKVYVHEGDDWVYAGRVHGRLPDFTYDDIEGPLYNQPNPYLSEYWADNTNPWETREYDFTQRPGREVSFSMVVDPNAIRAWFLRKHLFDLHGWWSIPDDPWPPKPEPCALNDNVVEYLGTVGPVDHHAHRAAGDHLDPTAFPPVVPAIDNTRAAQYCGTDRKYPT